MRLPVALAAAASLAALAVPNTAQALTWNWSFNGSNSSGQGTFTSAGSIPTAFTNVAITGITGTYTRFNTGNNGTYAIVGIDSDVFGSNNLFQWTGSNSSPIYADVSGIGLLTTAGSVVSVTFQGSGFGPINNANTQFDGTDGNITSSTLSPVLPPSAPVPGPLPLFGAGAAFGWSRRLRRRVKFNALKTTSLSTSPAIHSVLPL